LRPSFEGRRFAGRRARCRRRRPYRPPARRPRRRNAMSTAAPERLVLGVPSKGRLMEETANAFAASGLTLRKTGNERGYRGEIAELPGVDVAFISASEIAWYLKTGR